MKLSGEKRLIEELYKLKWNDDSITFHEVIRRLYVDEELGTRKLARRLYVSQPTALRYVREEGIQRRIKWK